MSKEVGKDKLVNNNKKANGVTKLPTSEVDSVSKNIPAVALNEASNIGETLSKAQTPVYDAINKANNIYAAQLLNPDLNLSEKERDKLNDRIADGVKLAYKKDSELKRVLVGGVLLMVVIYNSKDSEKVVSKIIKFFK